MKGSLLTGLRALGFALGAFLLMALGGIKVRSSMDVFLFVLGLVALWVLIEKVFVNMKQKQGSAPRR